jgi:hypothetical protein
MPWRFTLVPIIFDTTNTNARSDPRIIRDQLGSSQFERPASPIVAIEEDSKSIATMADEEVNKLVVWVKLVIDGHGAPAAFTHIRQFF